MKWNNKKGFSLLELVMVCVMIGILTAVALPKYRRAMDRARVGEALSLIRSIYDSCERYGYENPVLLDDGSEGAIRTCWAAVSEGGANFKKLDIAIKGKFVEGSNAKKLQTNNFTYELTGNQLRPVVAVANKPPYQNAKVVFDGSDFFCDVEDASAGEGKKACAVWGACTWKEWTNENPCPYGD